MEMLNLDLVEKLYDCQTMCNYCFNACLEEENVKSMVDCIKLNSECAGICEHVITALSFEDGFSQNVLNVCIKACEACIAECRKHYYLQCFECSKACKECIQACEDYIKMCDELNICMNYA